MNDPKLAWQSALKFSCSRYVLKWSEEKQFEKAIRLIVRMRWLSVFSSFYFLILLYFLESSEPLFKDGYQLDDHFILGTYNVLGEEKTGDEVAMNDKNPDAKEEKVDEDTKSWFLFNKFLFNYLINMYLSIIRLSALCLYFQTNSSVNL